MTAQDIELLMDAAAALQAGRRDPMLAALLRALAAPSTFLFRPLRGRQQPLRFQTNRGVWMPKSVMPAGRLLVLAHWPNRWIPMTADGETLAAVRAGVKRALADLDRVDPELAAAMALADGRSASSPGLHFRGPAGDVEGLLRVPMPRFDCRVT